MKHSVEHSRQRYVPGEGRGGGVGEGGCVAMNGPSTHLARYDPALGRVPTRVAQALFSGEDWVTTADLAIATALEAAAPNTRRAWRNDWAVFRAWALGRAAQWFPAEGERVRLPLLPELLVRFIQDLTAGEGGDAPRSIATVRRYLSTLSTLHRLLDVPDPTKAAVVRNTLKARARRSGGQVQAAPLRWAQVEAVMRGPAGRSGRAARQDPAGGRPQHPGPARRVGRAGCRGRGISGRRRGHGRAATDQDGSGGGAGFPILKSTHDGLGARLARPQRATRRTLVSPDAVQWSSLCQQRPARGGACRPFPRPAPVRRPGQCHRQARDRASG